MKQYFRSTEVIGVASDAGAFIVNAAIEHRTDGSAHLSIRVGGNPTGVTGTWAAITIPGVHMDRYSDPLDAIYLALLDLKMQDRIGSPEAREIVAETCRHAKAAIRRDYPERPRTAREAVWAAHCCLDAALQHLAHLDEMGLEVDGSSPRGRDVAHSTDMVLGRASVH